MDEMDSLTGDMALKSARDDLIDAALAMTRAHEKLKILEAALTQLSTAEQSIESVPEESYSYIALDLGDFFDALYDLEGALKADADYRDADLAHRRYSFLEIGCGSGRNLFLLGATDRFEVGQMRGFDISPELIEHGRKVFGFTDQIGVGDCKSFDYGDFDVVYFYRPFSDMAAEEAFEDYLVRGMKPGAYVIGCSNLTFADDRRLISKCENDRIFKKLR
ncbi:class I SAM-dependent methyltransferase [Actibacterium ureilyticum]|uniref:class I SAM-dependent methyltransferase n=1 Tax=Actibacterium ureilyticum TaxID=1590614 RepID=UPI0015956F7E|nr:class I SAM-dependent methyltransferase [Actibacterium ureilyticum]